MADPPRYLVCALYKFTPLADPAAMRGPLLATLRQNHVRGTLILAPEGINGTLAGPPKHLEQVLAQLNADPRLAPIDCQRAWCETPPFNRARVKLRREIVTMGIANIDPQQATGTHIDPADWNALLADPDLTLIDTRNHYEVAIGSFKGAINPRTKNFRDFPAFVAAHLDPRKHRKIAMFCTGGIRCEKSTAYLKQQGFPTVHQLRGGILNYLARVPAKESKWQGECFVFDERVAVNHRLEPGTHTQCHACRHPLTENDRQNPLYRRGISCPHCHGLHPPARQASFAERAKQIRLARQRNESHLGEEAANIMTERRNKKRQRATN
ncbi:MAG: rhodanese-related sulfurtransferase [Cellvibrionales bacterium]|nr:rhodanese-related sulfurtransferase [Cellvibrionales bacterium]